MRFVFLEIGSAMAVMIVVMAATKTRKYVNQRKKKNVERNNLCVKQQPHNTLMEDAFQNLGSVTLITIALMVAMKKIVRITSAGVVKMVGKGGHHGWTIYQKDGCPMIQSQVPRVHPGWGCLETVVWHP